MRLAGATPIADLLMDESSHVLLFDVSTDGALTEHRGSSAMLVAP